MLLKSEKSQPYINLFFKENITMQLQFISFPYAQLVEVVEINPRGRQGAVYPK